jgi:hypothetical protein
MLILALIKNKEMTANRAKCMRTASGNLLVFLPKENAYVYLTENLDWLKTKHEETTGTPTSRAPWNKLLHSTTPANATVRELDAAKRAIGHRNAFFEQFRQGKQQLEKFQKRYGKKTA